MGQTKENLNLKEKVQKIVVDSKAQRVKVGLLAKNSVQQRIQQDPDGFWQFIHNSSLWGRTEEELAEDSEGLALCVWPEHIYDIGLSRVSLSSRRAKQSYVQELPDLLKEHIFGNFDILDILWRYRIESNMLRDEALEEGSKMHRDLTQLISEHCQWLGIEPSK